MSIAVSVSETTTSVSTVENTAVLDSALEDVLVDVSDVATEVSVSLLPGLGYTPVDKAGDTMTGALTIGAGDAANIYNTTTAQWLATKKGTAGSPDATLNPLVKAERTLNVAEVALTGDGADQLATILGVAVGTAACEGQPVGVFGAAKTASTAAGATAGGNDACGIYGHGLVTGSATGVGIGGFLSGKRDTNTGKANGLEVSINNNTASAVSYNPTGFSDTTGIWLHASGTARGGVGLAFGNPFAAQLDVGIGFTSQGTGGPILTASIRDDSSATTVLDVNGLHTDAIDLSGATLSGLALKTAAGHRMLVGAASSGFTTTTLEAIRSGNADPHVAFRATDSSFVTVYVQNSAGSMRMFAAGGSGNGLTGTAAGDTGIICFTSGKAFHIGGTAKVITVTNADTLGFFGVTPVARVTTYAASNVITDRTYDANATTIDELADVLGTLIADLRSYGLVT